MAEIRFLRNRGSFQAGETTNQLTNETARALVNQGFAAWVTTMAETPAYLQAWADAITTHEGWFAPGSRAGMPRGSSSWRHNNPGNLVQKGQYQTFATYAEGRAALIADLQAKVQKYANWTVLQVMERYCPPPDGNPLNRGNDPIAYTAAVAKALFVMPATKVSLIAEVWSKTDVPYKPAVFAHA